MNEAVIKKTQDSLGKIIKKPPMTEKLLNKPPFRFLHDVITSVIKTTGLATGLFDDKELVADNVKEKEPKMAFLQKGIDFVSLIVGRQLSARPSKIVAGHEPERTNEFLQALAEAIKLNVDNDDFVKRTLAGEKPGSEKKKEKTKERERDKSSDGRKKEKERPRDVADKVGTTSGNAGRSYNPARAYRKDTMKDDEKKPERSRDKKSEKGKSRERESSEKRETTKEDGDSKDRDRDRRRKERRDREKEREAEKENNEEVEGAVVNGHAEEESRPRPPRPTSAKGSRRPPRNGHQSDSSEGEEESPARAPKSASKRREAPASNGTLAEEDLPPQVQQSRKLARPSSARPAAPRPKDKPLQDDGPVGGAGNAPNVIIDKGGDSDDDDEAFVTKEDPLLHQPEPDLHTAPDTTAAEEGGEHGGLVKKILETKKELEAANQHQPKIMKKTEIERSGLSEAARRKERDMAQKEVDKLRGSIQTLTRSANPLGKIMDFLQEDLDSMQKELDQWKGENQTNQSELTREQSITDNSIEPLRAQLADLDQHIADQLDIIAAVKSSIMRNDEKLEKMLSTVTKA